MKHYAQPKTDGQRLFNLQYDYKNGRTAALGEMYGLLRVIAYKTINKISNGDEHVKSLSASERESKAHDAATYIIEQYIKRPTFCINKSMTGYLHSRIMRELYGGRKCDKMLVFTDELPERKAERHEYRCIVTDRKTGERETYASLGELLLAPAFHSLRKKRLVECIRNDTTWKNYRFELLEI